jgi:hypothetical protein
LEKLESVGDKSTDFSEIAESSAWISAEGEATRKFEAMRVDLQ